jgi:asparagine synthase (glutamine-hydrolysing)
VAGSLSCLAVSSWFLVVPDTDALGEVAARARAHATREIPHASGRPWLLGRWSKGAVTEGRHGRTRVVVIGEHDVTVHEASRAAATASAPAGLDRFAGTWPGSHHLVASVDGAVRVQGTVTGVRRVFHARVNGAVVAADRADILADLLGADLDETRLAVQLLSSGGIHPLSARPVWRGVETLPGSHYLVLGPDGRARTVRWWRPPAHHVPLAEAAPAFRDVLGRAVELRTRARDTVTADLGGLDSTAVLSTAARVGAKVVAFTAATHDVQGDDVEYARRTVAALEGVEHHVVPAEQVPLTFDGLDRLDDVLDSPSMFAVDHSRRMSLVEMAAERGSQVHLTGFGGDELLGGASARVHDLLLTQPRTAVRHTRGYLAKYRWSRRSAARQLLDRRPYRAWLDEIAAGLTAPLPSLDEPLFQWCAPPRMPPWATPDAVDAVRRLVRAEAPAAEPLGRGHGEHRELATMEAVSRFARHINQMTGPRGLVFAAPYYDDRVVEAGLAVRPEERVTPWRYKPLIVEAMRGVVPEASRARATRANATLEEEVGMRRHRRALLALWEDSRLEQLGLVDAAALREWCSRPGEAELENAWLHPSVACEVWLRSRENLTDPTSDASSDASK